MNRKTKWWLGRRARLALAALLMLLIIHAAIVAQPAPKGYPTNGEVFLGWMKYVAHVQIQFVKGGFVTYGREDMKDITKELEAGLKCVKQEWKPKHLKEKK